MHFLGTNKYAPCLRAVPTMLFLQARSPWFHCWPLLPLICIVPWIFPLCPATVCVCVSLMALSLSPLGHVAPYHLHFVGKCLQLGQCL